MGSASSAMLLEGKRADQTPAEVLGLQSNMFFCDHCGLRGAYKQRRTHMEVCHAAGHGEFCCNHRCGFVANRIYQIPGSVSTSYQALCDHECACVGGRFFCQRADSCGFYGSHAAVAAHERRCGIESVPPPPPESTPGPGETAWLRSHDRGAARAAPSGSARRHKKAKRPASAPALPHASARERRTRSQTARHERKQRAAVHHTREAAKAAAAAEREARRVATEQERLAEREAAAAAAVLAHMDAVAAYAVSAEGRLAAIAAAEGAAAAAAAAAADAAAEDEVAATKVAVAEKLSLVAKREAARATIRAVRSRPLWRALPH